MIDHPYVPTPFPNRDICDARIEANNGHVTQCGERKAEHPVLVCSGCGAQPTAAEGKWTARLGGTHYRRFGRHMPSSGQTLDVANPCGKWVTKEEREKLVRERGG